MKTILIILITSLMLSNLSCRHICKYCKSTDEVVEDSTDILIKDIQNLADTTLIKLRNLNSLIHNHHKLDTIILNKLRYEKPIFFKVQFIELFNYTKYEIKYEELLIKARHYYQIPYNREEDWFIVGNYKSGEFIDIENQVSVSTIEEIKSFCLSKSKKKK